MEDITHIFREAHERRVRIGWHEDSYALASIQIAHAIDAQNGYWGPYEFPHKNDERQSHNQGLEKPRAWIHISSARAGKNYADIWVGNDVPASVFTLAPLVFVEADYADEVRAHMENQGFIVFPVSDWLEKRYRLDVDELRSMFPNEARELAQQHADCISIGDLIEETL